MRKESTDHSARRIARSTAVFSAATAVVGSESSTADFTALGDNVNITARLASEAGPGEILISDAAYSAAHLNLENLEHRQMELKGKSERIGVHVLRVVRDQ